MLEEVHPERCCGIGRAECLPSKAEDDRPVWRRSNVSEELGLLLHGQLQEEQARERRGDVLARHFRRHRHEALRELELSDLRSLS
eukprot:3812701-Pleurochrysis_carterae.AAC.1